MQNTYMDYAQGTCDAIEILVNSALSKAKFDRTIQASIVECIDELEGIYRVRQQDATYVAKTENPNIKYAKGTNVNILIPENDYSKNKQIIGVVGSNLKNLTDLQKEQQNSMINVNAISMKEKSINYSSYDKNQEYILYDATKNDNIIEVEDGDLYKYLLNSNSLIFSFDLKTKVPRSQQYKGIFGFKIVAIFETESEEVENATHVFEFSSREMSGTIFNLSTFIKQQKSFICEGSKFQKIQQIIFFKENFEEKDNVEDDIFFNNLYLGVANIDMNIQWSEYNIALHTPQGTTIKNDSLSVEAIVYLDDKKINVEKLQYYWFQKDASIQLDSAFYCKYGGVGWRCLNNLIDNNWEPATNIFMITKDLIPSYESEFQCIVVLGNDVIGAKGFVINNSGAAEGVQVQITSETGFKFLLEKGMINLVCSPTGNNYKYYWMSTDSNGTTAILDEHTNTLKNITADKIIYYGYYSCTVYDGDKYIGSHTVKLENEATPQNVNYNLVINNGNQIFKYDANGVAPNSSLKSSPQSILPLSFVLYDKLGTAITEVDEVQWIFPDSEDTLLLAPENTSLKEILFNIKNNYDLNKNQNDVLLQVKFKEHVIKAKTNFMFLKDGENGTNGTEYFCKIVPEYKKSINDSMPIVYYSTQTKESVANFNALNIEFYKNGQLIPNGYEIELKPLTRDLDDYFSINAENKVVFNSTKTSLPANPNLLIQGIVTYDNKKYYGVIPIVLIATTQQEDISEIIPHRRPFEEVRYDNTGYSPTFDEFRNSFSIRGIPEGYGYWIYSNYGDAGITSIGSGINRKITPPIFYNGYSTNNGIFITFQNKRSIRIYFPIYLYLNRHSFAHLNDWDGNSIVINKEGSEEYILTPQLGAGTKDENNNFTGVVMGEIKSNDASKVGLFGYGNGVETFFLDSNTGLGHIGPWNFTQSAFHKGELINDTIAQKAGNIYLGEQGIILIGKNDQTILNFDASTGGLAIKGILDNQGGIAITDNLAKIGPWVIHKSETSGTPLSLYINNSTFGAEDGVYLGVEGISVSDDFQVKADGTLISKTLTNELTKKANTSELSEVANKLTLALNRIEELEEIVINLEDRVKILENEAGSGTVQP